ncbi:MAG: TetR/AcrR family transcriptional regulator [Bacteroidales bacterium]|nr:TetR/AcrR family transcriptional regulator [Paludibacter sp.]MDD3844472.1 TetR/AcrR family transcriptional regulator [Bacteroidales bacterium]MDD4429293.1 TetR/AcrR family transcriptional regulator [Paludibacter sp.]
MAQERDQNFEQIILETAERLFLEKGYVMTSTTEIAAEAGCNQALVHYYFRTKEKLFDSIFEKRFSAFFNAIFDFNFNNNLSFEQKIRQIIESHFDLLSAHPKMISLVINELSRRPDHIKTIKQNLQSIPLQVIGSLEKELQQEIKKGNIKTDITMMDLVITMVSLNASLFLMMPVAAEILGMEQLEKDFVIKKRRGENVKIILRYLGYDSY